MGDTYDDEEFEDYDDEFEEEEELDDAPPPQAAPRATPMVPQQQFARQPDPQALRERQPAGNITRGPMTQLQQPMMMTTPAPMMKTEVELPQRRFIAPPSNEARQLKDLRAARLKALRPVLQLRAVEMTLYDAAPLTPYELHTRHASTKRAKMVQTGDDDVSIGVQTEEIETDVAACQWPEDGTAPGSSSANLEQSASAKTATLLTANIGTRHPSMHTYTRHIHTAGPPPAAVPSRHRAACALGARS